MKRAVIYARVSDRKQADRGISVDAQIEHCTARAEQLGATVVKVFRDDGKSGRSTEKRTAFNAAVAYCEAVPTDFLITWSTSRFCRNAMDLWVQPERLKDVGTKLECLNADIDDETDIGVINKSIWGLLDQMQSRQISKDTLRSMKKMASEGYFTGGRVPFGYVVERDDRRGRLTPHPVESAVVRRCFDLALQGLGTLAIMSKLNEAGTFRRAERWKKTTVHFLLTNELYTGVKTFNRTSGRTKRAKPRSEWIQIASHEGLVSRDDFEKVQVMMQDRSIPSPKGGTPRSAFVFSGIIRCGICGGALQIVNGTGRRGTLYSYYGCCAHKRGLPRCLFRNVRADQFDEWLIGEILDRVMTADVMSSVIDEVTSKRGKWIQERAAQRVYLVRQLRDLEGRRNKLYDVLELQGTSAPDLEDMADRLKLRNTEIREIQARLSLLEEAHSPKTARRIEPAVAAEVMREVVLASNTTKKRALMGALLESATVYLDRVLIEYRVSALISMGHPDGVRSGEYWLPELSPLRTRVVEILRPFMLKSDRSSAVTAVGFG